MRLSLKQLAAAPATDPHRRGSAARQLSVAALAGGLSTGLAAAPGPASNAARLPPLRPLLRCRGTFTEADLLGLTAQEFRDGLRFQPQNNL